MEPIILASGSPRRQEILKTLGVPFQVIIPEVDESELDGVELEKISEYLASKKVEYVSKILPAKKEVPWILGADTTMIMDGKVYGKPADIDEAVMFLKEFSGRTHTVYTSIALYNGRLKYLSTRTARTDVTFAPLSQDEIDWYISTGEWHNVAGGYRIQGFGSYFIRKIEGTSSTVIGLPLFELYDMLKEQGYSLIGLE